MNQSRLRTISDLVNDVLEDNDVAPIGRTYHAGSVFYGLSEYDHPPTPEAITQQPSDLLNPWVYILCLLVTLVVAAGCIWAC